LASLHDGGVEVPAFMVRPAAKDHGTKEQISSAYADDGEPLLRRGRKVAIVDDVITTGGSVKGAMDAVRALGCEIAVVIALVERHERGGNALTKEGYNFRRLFYTTEQGDLLIDERLPQRAAVLSGA
jgi:orotate phosphoribosyltransferase